MRVVLAVALCLLGISHSKKFCPAGTYFEAGDEEGGQSACPTCPEDTYSNHPSHNTECFPCPPGKVSFPGTKHSSHCHSKKLKNIALNKKTEQIDTYDAPHMAYYADSSLAVDGITSGHIDNGSITHTNSKVGAYWKVYLSGKAYIGKIVVYNRLDVCCQSGLDGVVVFVDDIPIGIISQEFGVQVYTFDTDVLGKTVLLLGNGGDYLTLAEVEVYGEFLVPASASVKIMKSM